MTHHVGGFTHPDKQNRDKNARNKTLTRRNKSVAKARGDERKKKRSTKARSGEEIDPLRREGNKECCSLLCASVESRIYVLTQLTADRLGTKIAFFLSKTLGAAIMSKTAS